MRQRWPHPRLIPVLRLERGVLTTSGGYKTANGPVNQQIVIAVINDILISYVNKGHSGKRPVAVEYNVSDLQIFFKPIRRGFGSL